MGKGKGKQQRQGKRAAVVRQPPRTGEKGRHGKAGKGKDKGKGKGKTKRRQPVDEGDDEKFRHKLSGDGYLIKDMEGDGNCLFRSISDQLHDDKGAKHDLVRHDICNYLEQNRVSAGSLCSFFDCCYFKMVA